MTQFRAFIAVSLSFFGGANSALMMLEADYIGAVIWGVATLLMALVHILNVDRRG